MSVVGQAMKGLFQVQTYSFPTFLVCILIPEKKSSLVGENTQSVVFSWIFLMNTWGEGVLWVQDSYTIQTSRLRPSRKEGNTQ